MYAFMSVACIQVHFRLDLSWKQTSYETEQSDLGLYCLQSGSTLFVV